MNEENTDAYTYTTVSSGGFWGDYAVSDDKYAEISKRYTEHLAMSIRNMMDATMVKNFLHTYTGTESVISQTGVIEVDFDEPKETK